MMRCSALLGMMALLFAAALFSPPASAAEEALPVLVERLKASPDDDALRERIILLARRTAPETPEAAERHLGRAQGFAETPDPAAIDKVIAELHLALAEAPWLARAYFNLGVAQEKTENFGDAMKSFERYLLAAPDAENAAAVKRRLYALEAKAEQAAAKEVQKKAVEAALAPSPFTLKTYGTFRPAWLYSSPSGKYIVMTPPQHDGWKLVKVKKAVAFDVMTEAHRRRTEAGDLSENDPVEFYVRRKDGVYAAGVSHARQAGNTSLRYDPPRPVYPLPLEVGKTWEYEGKREHVETVYGAKGTKTKLKIDEKGSVSRRESVTVPAGTFDCFVVESSGTWDGKPTSSTVWVSTAVGRVKMLYDGDEHVLLDYDSGDAVRAEFGYGHHDATYVWRERP